MPTNPEKVESAKSEKKRKNGAEGGRKPKSNPKLAIVQDAIRLMDEAGIGELHFEQSGVKIHLRKGQGMPFAPVMPIAAPVASAAPMAPAAPASAAAPAKSDNTVTLNSPMVGTFYRAASPDAKPFIEEGGKIAVGQVYCIVEAMKLMNEVKSEVAGKVVKILVQNGQAIEFNQPLLIIDPS